MGRRLRMARSRFPEIKLSMLEIFLRSPRDTQERKSSILVRKRCFLGLSTRIAIWITPVCAGKFCPTTTANLTAFPELISQIQAPVRTWWFAELIDVRSPERANEIVDLAIEFLKPAPNWGLAPHALFTASRDLYWRCEEVARREKILLTTHLAESREEMEMFRQKSGSLYEFMKSIGRPIDDCG